MRQADRPTRTQHTTALATALAITLAMAMAMAMVIGSGLGRPSGLGGAVALAVQPQPNEPPDVRGDPVDEAVLTLEAAGYEVTLEPGDAPDGADRARVVVLEQAPVSDVFGNTSGALLTLGAEVPEAVGLTQAAAVDEITAVGLRPDGLITTSGDPDSLIVTEQDPDPGTELTINESVTLTVEIVVDERVLVPQLIGQSRAAAADRAGAVGLELVVQGDDADDPVMTQDPLPDTLVARGSPVTVTLSAAPPSVPPSNPPSVAVPDLKGLDQEAARALLAAVGLTLRADVDGDPSGATAVDQDPPAGTAVLPPATVDVTFAVLNGNNDPPWLLLAAGLLGLIATGIATVSVRRAARQRRERRWLEAHVRLSGDMPPPAFVQLEPDPDALSYSVRLNTHPDRGHEELRVELYEERR